jgi:hypothetical protein
VASRFWVYRRVVELRIILTGDGGFSDDPMMPAARERARIPLSKAQSLINRARAYRLWCCITFWKFALN